MKEIKVNGMKYAYDDAIFTAATLKATEDLRKANSEIGIEVYILIAKKALGSSYLSIPASDEAAVINAVLQAVSDEVVKSFSREK